MNLSSLLGLADGWETFTAVEKGLTRGRRAVLLEGMPVAAKGWFLARLFRDTNRPFLLITYNDEQAARLTADLKAFLPEGTPPRSHPVVFATASAG